MFKYDIAKLTQELYHKKTNILVLTCIFLKLQRDVGKLQNIFSILFC